MRSSASIKAAHSIQPSASSTVVHSRSASDGRTPRDEVPLALCLAVRLSPEVAGLLIREWFASRATHGGSIRAESIQIIAAACIPNRHTQMNAPSECDYGPRVAPEWPQLDSVFLGAEHAHFSQAGPEKRRQQARRKQKSWRSRTKSRTRIAESE